MAKTVVKRKAPARSRKATAQPTEQVELVVRRGSKRRFAALKRKTAELPVVISWDRRENERRSDSSKTERDRRHSDRRQETPFTWELADFVVVSRRAAPARKRSAKS